MVIKDTEETLTRSIREATETLADMDELICLLTYKASKMIEILSRLNQDEIVHNLLNKCFIHREE